MYNINMLNLGKKKKVNWKYANNYNFIHTQ